MEKWSCIACDQFTSEPAYWESVSRITGTAPGAVKMIVPEAFLGGDRERELEAEAEKTMRGYAESGLFRVLKDSFVYVERSLSSGVRRGIVGALDLEAYDWRRGSDAPVRATEDTVEERLPPRIRVRSEAAFEMPHIMVFINDPSDSLIPSAAGGEALYDFSLMMGGGRIKGSRVAGEKAARLAERIDSMEGALRFAVGDGNHSLAAAKKCWEALKPGLRGEDRKTHPMRYALCELVNIHDEAVTIEPIHRLLAGVDAADFFSAAREKFADESGGYPVTFVAAGRELTLHPRMPIGALVAETEKFCLAAAEKVDYIHGGENARRLAGADRCAAVLLPAVEKSGLFGFVEKNGAFPRKSFSVGKACDKRYYLECRAIG